MEWRMENGERACLPIQSAKVWDAKTKQWISTSTSQAVVVRGDAEGKISFPRKAKEKMAAYVYDNMENFFEDLKELRDSDKALAMRIYLEMAKMSIPKMIEETQNNNVVNRDHLNKRFFPEAEELK